MTDIRAITSHNRAEWNAVAERRRANCQSPEFFRAGGSTLDEEETAAMGDVRGKRLLNLLCGSGNDALSWAVKGASVVGVDISDVAIAIAREQAAATGLAATFVAADVYDLPDSLQDSSFDIVYSTAGIMCWMPDLAEWARIVARALRPGGRFLMDEHHPIWEHTNVTADGIRVTGSYFSRGTPQSASSFDIERSAHAGAEALVMDTRVFTWPLGDVVTALANAGLRIEQLIERADPEMYVGADATAAEHEMAKRLPAAYLLVASKPIHSDLSGDSGPM